MTSLVAQTVKHLPIMWETRVQSLRQEDLLEKEMATDLSSLAWKIPRMEEPSDRNREKYIYPILLQVEVHDIF